MTILDWIIDLVRDSKRFEEFRRNPKVVLNRAVRQKKLLKKQKDVLLSGDPVRIRHVIEYEAGLDPGKVEMHLIIPVPMHQTYPPAMHMPPTPPKPPK
jgi:hypothetical protein